MSTKVLKHTPSPWFVEKPSVNTLRYSIYAGTEVKPTWIADIYTAKNREDGNAVLISAAPEMLASLEAVAEWYNTVYTHYFENDCPPVFTNVIKAIERATTINY